VTKALRLSREIFVQQPSLIRLEKRIPMQSGLGGGSSDAAGLLRALQAASGDASQAELASVACGVGADVPFFLSGGRARGEGYGDVITALPDPAEEWYVIAKPEIGCSTPEMYALLDGESREWRDWPLNDNLYNDFERVAPRECIDLIERMLTAGARDAALSGSGSSVFGRFATHATARDAEERLRGDDVNQVWVAKSLTRSESLDIKRSL
jgi:4-diphosphocytidyl-2-C-methyl-D-erythritol kinase